VPPPLTPQQLQEFHKEMGLFCCETDTSLGRIQHPRLLKALKILRDDVTIPSRSLITSPLFTLPADLLPLIFSFLSPKDLCRLDSAVLNHTDRSIFLPALSQRFYNVSDLSGDGRTKLMIDWYLCRRIPVTTLDLRSVGASKVITLISINSKTLKEITLYAISLILQDAPALVLALGDCSTLKKVTINQCAISSGLDLSSILPKVTGIETLPLIFPSLKFLNLSYLFDLGDVQLRRLVESSPSLRSLRLSNLVSITNESVRMLMSHLPRIPSIGIRSCSGVSWESALPLLREITIPTIFNSDGDEELQMDALDNLTYSIKGLSSTTPHLIDFLSSELVVKRLLDLMCLKSGQFRCEIVSFILVIYQVHAQLVVDAGTIPVLIRLFPSFTVLERFHSMNILESLSDHIDYRPHILSSGVLSIFRTELLQVVVL
jgi:hypothetical protein